MVRPSARHNRQRRSILLKIPPVTFLLDVFMILAYFGCRHFYNLVELIVLNVGFPVPQRILFQIPLVRRALLSALYHRRKWHLALDLAWTLVIGIELENSLGGWRFLYNVGIMHAISQGLGALFNVLLSYVMKDSENIKPGGSVGFSAILLSLNFVVLASPRGRSRRRRRLSPIDVLIASVPILVLLQMLAPDARMTNNIAGTLAGFLFVNTPPVMDGFVAWVLLAYSEAVQLILSICESSLWEANWDEMDNGQARAMEEEEGEIGRRDQNNEGDGLEERNQEASSLRHGPEFSREENDRGNQVKEEQEVDKLLQWKCHVCYRNNGVFFVLCEECRTPRDSYALSNFSAYRHSSSNSLNYRTHYMLRHPSLQLRSRERLARMTSTLQLPSHKEVPDTLPSAPPVPFARDSEE